MIEALALGCLTLWFVLNMSAQFNGAFSHKLRRNDAFGIFPCWRLFSLCESYLDDYYIVWRALDERHLPVGGWTEVRFVRKNLAYAWLWNWGRRDRVAVAHVVAWLRADCSLEPDKSMLARFPYRLLLSCATRHIPPTVARFQFAILRVGGPAGLAKSRLVLLSQAHSVTDVLA